MEKVKKSNIIVIPIGSSEPFGIMGKSGSVTNRKEFIPH
jgi:hypothetical protein